MSVPSHSHLDGVSYAFSMRLRSFAQRYVPVLALLLAFLGIYLLSSGRFLGKGMVGMSNASPAMDGRSQGSTGSLFQQVPSDPSAEVVYEAPSSDSVDGYLHFEINKGEQSMANVQALLKRYCRRVQMVSQRFQDNGHGEIVYRLVLSDPSYSDDLVEQLESLSGISQITFMLHEE